jgi:DNA-binding response OmpR family regulator
MNSHHMISTFLCLFFAGGIGGPGMASTGAGGRRVLLLEDEGAIAIDLADQLERAGYTVAGPFSRCNSSLEWLQSSTPDLALLDLVLADGPCTAVALELRKRSIPFVVFSGAAEEFGPDLLEAIRGAPVVSKPGRIDMVLAMLSML